jgi:hypothetical protein
LEDAGVVAFASDPGQALLDEASPTSLDIGRLLIGFLVGGVILGLALVLLARPLQRRLGPALAVGIDDDAEEAP